MKRVKRWVKRMGHAFVGLVLGQRSRAARKGDEMR